MVITYPSANGGYKTADTCAVWMTEYHYEGYTNYIDYTWHALAREEQGVYVIVESRDHMFAGLTRDQVKYVRRWDAYETAKRYGESVPDDLRQYQTICTCDGSLELDISDFDQYLRDLMDDGDNIYDFVHITVDRNGQGRFLYFPIDGYSPRTDRNYVFVDRYGCTISIRFDGDKFVVTNRTIPADSVSSVRELLDLYGMTQAEFSRRFDIPCRTVSNWCNGVNTPPPYVFRLLGEALSHDTVKQTGGAANAKA